MFLPTKEPRQIFPAALAAVLLLACLRPANATVLAAGSYARHFFTAPDLHAAVQASGELSGGSWGTAGWVEYSFRTDEAGWHELLTHGAAPSGVEFIVDPDRNGEAPPERYFHHHGYPAAAPAKVGNVWLTAGAHVVRLQRHHWTGFPRLTSVELRRARDELGNALHVYFDADHLVFRGGQCPALVVHGGGGGTTGRLEILDSSLDGSRIHARHQVIITASAMPAPHTVRLSCSQPGFHRLTYRINGRPLAEAALAQIVFQVVDMALPAGGTRPTGGAAKPLADIDCAATHPDYVSQGGTRPGRVAGLAYRESGATGWIRWQRTGTAGRAGMPEPDWFAYRIPGVLPQQRYRVEVDYPDDAFRTFTVAWREPAPLKYPVAAAVETGREFRVSGAAQTLSFHVWARASGPRLVLMAAHDGDRAACIRIRVFLAGQNAPQPAAASPDGRLFLNWFEEGENFSGFFGAPADDLPGLTIATDRWLEAAAGAGVGTVMPTVAVYNFAMYPSRFHLAFSEPRRDTLRMLLLLAERRAIGVIPELHPRADELSYPDPAQPAGANLAISREGRDNAMGEQGRNVPPHFNALHPRNRLWYVGMVRELAARYRDSPAFLGISLRYMGWANAALNNLVSLDWGYDDYSIGLYRTETGSRVPAGGSDPDRFRRRHAWLMANERSDWIAWRCAKLTGLYAELAAGLRSVRPDLKLHLHLFGPVTAARTPGTAGGEPASVSQLREAGLDLQALARIDGLVIINSTFSYGRGERDGIFFAAARDSLLDARAMGAAPDGPEGQWFVPTSRYLEAIPEVLPPRRLGLADSTQGPWMSAASNPGGRQALERHALLLAQTDALAMGDGGNNYTLGPPVVAEFAREYRRLPRLPFRQLHAVDPVTVRSHATAESLVFYAVSREPYPIQLEISLLGDGRVARAGTTVEIDAARRAISIELLPYELAVFRADASLRITGARAQAPRAEHDRVAARIAWAEHLLATPHAMQPAGADARLLAAAVSTAREALQRGWLWTARTTFESSPVLQVFRRSACYPPDMVMDPPSRHDCPAS